MTKIEEKLIGLLENDEFPTLYFHDDDGNDTNVKHMTRKELELLCIFLAHQSMLKETK